MSVRTMARVWERSNRAGSELLMLLAIADFSDDDGKAYPAVQTLAKKCRMTPRNANLILSALRKSGELVIRQNEGPKGTNLYLVVLNPPPEAGFTPEESFTLKHSSPTPEAGFLNPLKPASDEPSVNHQEPSITRSAKKPRRVSSPSTSDSVPESFDEFWLAYDKKVGKANAIKVWKSIKPDAALVQLIVSAAKSYSSATERQYRKDPERWLKGRRWEDDAPSAGAAPKPEWMDGAI